MEEQDKKPSAGSSDEVALELMKFIATTTAYGRATQQQVGFSGKNSRSPEEQADSLIDLFRKCRAVVRESDPTA
jgi:hypothetical protein